MSSAWWLLRSLPSQGREPDDIVGAGSDTDICFFKPVKNIATDVVFQATNGVGTAEEANCQFSPIIGDAQKHARLQVGRFNKVAAMQPFQLPIIGPRGELPSEPVGCGCARARCANDVCGRCMKWIYRDGET